MGPSVYLGRNCIPNMEGADGRFEHGSSTKAPQRISLQIVTILGLTGKSIRVVQDGQKESDEQEFLARPCISEYYIVPSEVEMRHKSAHYV